jgi:hypothetical protein
MDQMLEWELKRFLLEAEKFSAEAEAIHKQRSEPGDGSFADPCGKAESPIHMADRLGYSDEVVFLKRMLENAKANRFHQEELDAWYVDHVRFLCVLRWSGYLPVSVRVGAATGYIHQFHPEEVVNYARS